MNAQMLDSRRYAGGAITEAGVYRGVPLERYHAGDICDGPSISSSGLRTIFNDSPAHYWVDSRLNPQRVEAKESEALILGRAVHHLLLGEPHFASLFVVRPEKIAGKPWQGNRLECKGWLLDQKEAGKTVLTPEQVENIKGMSYALGAHPLIRAGILNGQIERSIFWRDAETGVWLKSRPDAIPTASGDFADLKTTASVQGVDLIRTIAEHAYHQQGALVAEAARVVLNMPHCTFSLVFVEKVPPYCVRVVSLKPADLKRGEEQNHAALRTFAACMKRSVWPGPGGEQRDAEYMELPGWYQTRVDEQLKESV